MFDSNCKAQSVLLIAADLSCKDIVKLLIANGASVGVTDDNNCTPLHKASLGEHKEVVELLIANGALLDATTKDGCTPLYMAASHGHLTVARLLLDLGAKMEPNSLEIAVMLGEIELVKQSLDRGVSVNSQLTKGLYKNDSFLITAIRHKNKSMVELLLNKGARINNNTTARNISPLHQAVITGYRDAASCRELCEMLISRGADLNAKDKFGNTPLHQAALLKNNEIVALLLDCGADVNILNQENRSALFEAAKTHCPETVKSLLERGAKVNLTDNNGWTPLLCALQHKGGDKVIQILVAYDADVNVREGRKNLSPLHIAVAQNNKNMVEFLLAHGAREGLE